MSGRNKIRALVASLAIIGAATLGAFVSASAQQHGTEIIGVASAYDGDDLTINGTDVRLHGVDAPERGKRCGGVNVYSRATSALADIIRHRAVTCRVVDRDPHQRPVADCTVEGRDIGAIMVAAGWARDWPRFSHGRYASAETAARSAQRGIWGLACPADLWGNRNYSR